MLDVQSASITAPLTKHQKCPLKVWRSDDISKWLSASNLDSVNKSAFSEAGIICLLQKMNFLSAYPPITFPWKKSPASTVTALPVPSEPGRKIQREIQKLSLLCVRFVKVGHSIRWRDFFDRRDREGRETR